ncbi:MULTISPECIES: DUF1097 domain-containing protein [Flavobacterium]|uniref:DUF1097 domain-containing protein n=2 Tax=Flavobacterium TaxID=237 RepID=A0A0D0F105_9FLAO|nr:MULTISPECIES: DUF1097 domain-containing protein [Flavobacterium]KIO51622.1 hypothetical protein IW18_16920 [Flavobacterium hibernum]MCC9063685.1 DUF1097 domain-containing protein [Flavobacterium sp. F-30]OXA85267.1 hypothetical protein B0A73_18160 [Flavobacterium hibernum]STO11273.1 Protein of uncharacterised function (DUF1097) [Flavobacterium hibernum]
MKTFQTAIIFGLFGAVAVSISFAAQWPTWVMFIAWVSYYIFGRNIKNSAFAFIQIILGILMGVLIQLTGMFLGSYLGAIGLPVSIFIFIGSLAYISKIKSLSTIPAWFLGLIVFFGIHPKLEPLSLLELGVPLIFGFIFAFLNDTAVHKIQSASEH